MHTERFCVWYLTCMNFIVLIVFFYMFRCLILMFSLSKYIITKAEAVVNPIFIGMRFFRFDESLKQ